MRSAFGDNSSFFKNEPRQQGSKRWDPRRQWVPHHGQRQRARIIRQSYARVLKLKDADSKAALERLRAVVAGEPDPRECEIDLAHSAMVAAEETRQPWAVAMMHFLDQFERNAEEGTDLAVDARTGAPIAQVR